MVMVTDTQKITNLRFIFLYHYRLYIFIYNHVYLTNKNIYTPIIKIFTRTHK
jgi:hypothetical protein